MMALLISPIFVSRSNPFVVSPFISRWAMLLRRYGNTNLFFWNFLLFYPFHSCSCHRIIIWSNVKASSETGPFIKAFENIFIWCYVAMKGRKYSPLYLVSLFCCMRWHKRSGRAFLAKNFTSSKTCLCKIVVSPSGKKPDTSTATTRVSADNWFC